jgi:peptidoglycan/xylan/chitin deacetylase (PgdA/CDA1 family)
MASRVLLTIDTELGWGPHSRGASWEENLALFFDPAGVGVPWQLDVLRDHRLKACFFVDPMPALVHGLDPVRQMVEPILAAGQEIQLHLHPNWHGRGIHELTGYDAEAQRALIATARELLVAAGAPDPIALRSGSFAANADTLRALSGLGFRYDSSHNGSHHPDPSDLPLPPELIAPVEVGGVVEIPVTQIEDAPGRLRHLQLCAVSAEEMEAALLHALAEAHPLVTIVSHSFELASRDGRRPNRTLCRRFERLCALLAERAMDLPTVHFTELGDLPLGCRAEPLPARRLRTVRRQAEQLWSNAVYERAL